MAKDTLGGFELQVLLAVMRLGDDAYGVPIADTIEEASGREVAAGSIYITLDRLESKGFVTSRLGESTPERGGRAKPGLGQRGRQPEGVRSAHRPIGKPRQKSQRFGACPTQQAFNGSRVSCRAGHE